MKLIVEPSIMNWFMKILNNKDEYESFNFGENVKLRIQESRIIKFQKVLKLGGGQNFGGGGRSIKMDVGDNIHG